MNAPTEDYVICMYVTRRAAAGNLRNQQMLLKTRSELLAEGLMAMHREGKPMERSKGRIGSSSGDQSDAKLWQMAVQALSTSTYPHLRVWDATHDGQEAFLAEAAEMGMGEEAAELLRGLSCDIT